MPKKLKRLQQLVHAVTFWCFLSVFLRFLLFNRPFFVYAIRVNREARSH